MSPHAPRRLAFTKVELMLVVAILVVVAGILAPAIQAVREAAARMQSVNNLRLIGIAFHCMDEQNGKFAPAVGRFPVKKDHEAGPKASLFFHMIPFLESSNLYPTYKNNYEAIERDVVTIKCYRSPADPTITDERSTLTSYASNAAVFGLTDGGTVSMLDLARRGRFTHVLFTERYAMVGPEQTRHTWNGRGDRDNYLYPPAEALDPENMAAPQFSVPPVQARNDAPHSFVRKTFQVAMADGSVRTLTPDVTRTFIYADDQSATIWAWACSLDGPLGKVEVPSGW